MDSRLPKWMFTSWCNTTRRYKIINVNNMWIFNFFKQLVYLAWYRFYYVPTHRTLFSNLKKYKGIHSGQRVFIVATGPSLCATDLDLLKNEITFGMNSVFKMFDKTEWRPTYYCIADGGVYKKIMDQIDCQHLGQKFANDKIPWQNQDVIKIPIIQTLCHNDELREKFSFIASHSHTSRNIVSGVYMGNSVVHVITQICFYMGFSEIYYIGADCSNFKKHAADCEHNLSIKRSESSLANGIKADYQSDYAFAKKNSIKMYNATRGGALEIFPRVKLEDIVNK